MDNQLYNGFCPNCGALLRDGVCPSCGFSNRNGNMSGGSISDAAVDMTTDVTDAAADMTTDAADMATDAADMATDAADMTTDAADMATDNTVNVAAEHTRLRNYEKYQNTYLNSNDNNQNFNGQNGYARNDYSQSNYGQNNYEQNAYYRNDYGQNAYYQNTGTQNQDYWNGTTQGGYYQQNGNGYYVNQTPQKKKGKTGVVVAAVVGGLLFFCMIGIALLIFCFAILSTTEAHTEEDDLSDYSYDFDDYDYDDEYDDEYDYDYDYGYDEDRMAFVDDIAWNDSYWAKEPYNYDAEDVGDDYYYGLCNCMDKDVSYSMVHENYEELDKVQNVCIRINYYQLEGDIPNLDEINEALKFQAIWPGEIYKEWSEDFQEEFEEYGAGYVVSVESYVTYNDEKMISVVSDIYYESATTVKKMITAVNVDLETGSVLDNTDVLDLTDAFLNNYQEICEEQNGSIYIFQEFDNDELKEFFEDEDDLILFYTPCGLEVGINYETDEKYGWVTATITDYEQYLK